MEYSIKEEILTDIADAIREKSDNPDEYYPSEMPAAIRSIRGGSNVTMEDNPEGGVNLTVNEVTRNLALEEELAAWTETEQGAGLKVNGEEKVLVLLSEINDLIDDRIRNLDAREVSY